MRHGSQLDPQNRFERIERILDADDQLANTDTERGRVSRTVEFLDDQSQSIVTENKSPDLPFRFSINPYRGCEHGCAYCYARPTHEYLGLNAGLDFETKIIVKRNAPELFRTFLARKKWRPEPIAFSGVTDCYQPAERQFEITRGCLKVALECRQPIGIVTKNALVTRDLDLLRDFANNDLVHVFLSITTLNAKLAREMEPRTSIPDARLRAIEKLADARIPVGVMTAPIVPGLNDNEIPSILSAASSAGAQAAGYVLLRLPLSVETVFSEWLTRTRPDRADAIMQRIKSTRGGRSNDSNFGSRMVGTGEFAIQIKNLFQVFARKHGLDQGLPPQRCDLFVPPNGDGTQLQLF